MVQLCSEVKRSKSHHKSVVFSLSTGLTVRATEVLICLTVSEFNGNSNKFFFSATAAAIRTRTHNANAIKRLLPFQYIPSSVCSKTIFSSHSLYTYSFARAPHTV